MTLIRRASNFSFFPAIVYFDQLSGAERTQKLVETFIGHDTTINTGCTYKVISYRAGAGI